MRILSFVVLFLLPLACPAAELTLTWRDNSSGDVQEDGFEIWRSANGNDFVLVGEAAQDAQTWRDSGLPDGTQFWYRVRAFNQIGVSEFSAIASGRTLPALGELPGTPSDVAVESRGFLTNLSGRGQVEVGDAIHIGGFAITDGPATILIRGIGPTLGAAPYDVAGVLADPQLRLFRGSTEIAANDNWSGADVSAAAVAVGAFALPAGSKDAALLVTLPPGNYTVHLSGVGNTRGVALLELYWVR